MAPRKEKTRETATVEAPVRMLDVDKDKNAAGASQPGSDSVEDIGALRKEVDSLKAKVAEAAKQVRSRAAGISQQTEATIGIRPFPALLIAAAAATAIALIASRATAAPPRSRYRRLLDDLQ